MGEWIQIEKDRLGRAKRHVRQPKRTERGPRKPDPLADAPELRDGRLIVLGDARALVQRLNPHVVVGRFARGWLGVVGHYRQAHVEAGPFRTLGEARAAWVRIRRELAAFRQSRIDSRRTGTAWPPPGSVGSGWAAQAQHVEVCSGCARRVGQRRHLAREWGEAEPAKTPRAPAIVRRRDGIREAVPCARENPGS